MAYTGIGGSVTINVNGDRDADYSLLDMTGPDSRDFEVCVFPFQFYVVPFYLFTRLCQPLEVQSRSRLPL